MRIWCYNESNGALVTSPYADKGFDLEYSMVELPYFLFASSYTTIAPPTYANLQIPCYDGKKWKIKKDYRHLDAWSKVDGKKISIKEPDEEPDNYTTVSPSGLTNPIFNDETSTWREKTEKEIYEEAYGIDRHATVEALRHECQLVLESKYYRKEIDFKGKHVRADIDSQKIITGYIAEIGLGSRVYPLDWITVENDVVQITTKEELITLVNAMSEWIETAIFTCRQVKTAIDNATNASDSWDAFAAFRDAEI